VKVNILICFAFYENHDSDESVFYALRQPSMCLDLQEIPRHLIQRGPFRPHLCMAKFEHQTLKVLRGGPNFLKKKPLSTEAVPVDKPRYVPVL
jgi:hypothetical protein